MHGSTSATTLFCTSTGLLLHQPIGIEALGQRCTKTSSPLLETVPFPLRLRSTLNHPTPAPCDFIIGSSSMKWEHWTTEPKP